MYINRKYINESITFIINKNERNTVPLRSALYLVSSILIKVFIRNRCEGTASGPPVVSLKGVMLIRNRCEGTASGSPVVSLKGVMLIRNRCEGTASGSPVVSLKILENLKESIYLPALNSNFVVL